MWWWWAGVGVGAVCGRDVIGGLGLRELHFFDDDDDEGADGELWRRKGRSGNVYFEKVKIHAVWLLPSVLVALNENDALTQDNKRSFLDHHLIWYQKYEMDRTRAFERQDSTMICKFDLKDFTSQHLVPKLFMPRPTSAF